MRKLAIASACLFTCAGAAATAPAAPATPLPVVSIADQKPSVFSDARFRALHVRRTRYVAPWNMAIVARERTRFEQWLNAAHAAGIREVLVAFNTANGSRCPKRPCVLPSQRAYAHAFRSFHKRYPSIRLFQPWNEANSPTQPTAPWRNGARAAALYYNVVKRYCKRCTVTGADVLDLSRRTMIHWLGQFRRYANGRPLLWGLHNYTDTNRHSEMTRWFLRQVPGKVWLTETGGIVYFRRASGAVNLTYNEHRAARALKRGFTLARADRARVKRIYLYQWSIDFSGNRFDAGLVGADGKPRPGYWVVKHYRSWIR